MSRETEFLLPSPFHMQIEITFFDTTFCKSFVQEKMAPGVRPAFDCLPYLVNNN